MHALIEDGGIKKYPYTIGNLRKDNPHTSFPRRPSDEMLAEWSVYVVARADRPEVDPITQNLAEGTPVFADGQWQQTWIITDATPEEIAERKEQQLQDACNQRAAAYTQESDPLFFKWQAGEGNEQEWLAKREEIRLRYPYPALD